MPQLASKLVSWMKPDPSQPRKTFDEDDLRRLGESLKVRQNDPVQAKPDGTIIDGERRWRAAKMAGLENLDVIITDATLSDTQIDTIRLTSFFHRADLSNFEKWQACCRLLCGNPRWQFQHLADALKIDPSSVTRLMSPSKCIEVVQNALRDGKIGISDVYAISKLPEAEQAALLEMKLSGASRDQIEQAGRKRRNGSTATVKLASVRCPLSTGIVVSVRGPEMDLEGLIEALSSALESARKANKDSLDIRTAEKVWRDRSKVKG
jgi:ParB/RepB/Spo0J family partition protein